MDTTKSHVKIYEITPEVAKDFEDEFPVDDHELLYGLVPDRDAWGKLSWGINLEEYEYSASDQTMHLTLDTKWESPVEWLRMSSLLSYYFENKLMTMATIQKDETCVTGVAIMDGEVLQNKTIWSMELEEVAKYYDDDQHLCDVDDLDNLIWDSIGKFLGVCEKFYLEKEENK